MSTRHVPGGHLAMLAQEGRLAWQLNAEADAVFAHNK
jgi:hypothetical protein